jgi:hypothetical protein
MAIPAGYQWLHMTMRKRVVEQLDKVRGHTSRENYLAGLVEADVVARKDGTATASRTNSREIESE